MGLSETGGFRLLEIEGDTFDGLYMYYEGRYLYSWDTPYSVYEGTGYDVTERPWYPGCGGGGRTDCVYAALYELCQPLYPFHRLPAPARR